MAENEELRFGQLGEFDKAMIALVKEFNILADGYPYRLQMDEPNKTMVFTHGDLLFVFNWHPENSVADYAVEVREPGKYRPVLSTDEERFGGLGREDMASEHFTYPCEIDGEVRHFMQIYNTSRTATIFRLCR